MNKIFIFSSTTDQKLVSGGRSRVCFLSSSDSEYNGRVRVRRPPGASPQRSCSWIRRRLRDIPWGGCVQSRAACHPSFGTWDGGGGKVQNKGDRDSTITMKRQISGAGGIVGKMERDADDGWRHSYRDEFRGAGANARSTKMSQSESNAFTIMHDADT